MRTNNTIKRVLVTGGTAFVSRYTARWFLEHGWDVYVLNRGTKVQEKGVKHICADRHAPMGDALRDIHFDAVLDICAYTKQDVTLLYDALDSFDDYILISSSAVYPETNRQPFHETQSVGPNRIWGKYGTDKIEAENELKNLCPHAYILRPPYLYGPMQNVYREPFVFDCAHQGRPFFLPRNGEMKLQFFHVADLCRVMESILNNHPQEHTINVGNPDSISVRDFVSLCYAAANASAEFVCVHDDIPQRSYFCFHDYDYQLDVSIQHKLISHTVPLKEGLQESYAWYVAHPEDVNRKEYIDYIDRHLRKIDQ